MSVTIFQHPDEQKEVLRQVAERAQISMSELVRRLIDYGLREPVLNEMMPTASGKLLADQWRVDKVVQIHCS